MASRDVTKVGEYTHRETQSTVEIVYHKRDKVFRARLSDAVIEAESQKEVERKLKEHLDATMQIEWQKVLALTPDEAMTVKSLWASIGIHFKRFEVGRHPDGRLLKREWERPPTVFFTGTVSNPPRIPSNFYWDTKRDGEWALPTTSKRMNGGSVQTYYFPYTEEMWTGLEEVQKRIEELRDRLMEFLGEEAGYEQIALMGAQILKALPAPPAEEVLDA
jgi:hypothetical protein